MLKAVRNEQNYMIKFHFQTRHVSCLNMTKMYDQPFATILLVNKCSRQRLISETRFLRNSHCKRVTDRLTVSKQWLNSTVQASKKCSAFLAFSVHRKKERARGRKLKMARNWLEGRITCRPSNACTSLKFKQYCFRWKYQVPDRPVWSL